MPKRKRQKNRRVSTLVFVLYLFSRGFHYLNIVFFNFVEVQSSNEAVGNDGNAEADKMACSTNGNR